MISGSYFWEGKQVRFVWVAQGNGEYFSIGEEEYNKVSSSNENELAIYLCDPDDRIRKLAKFLAKKEV